MPNINEVFQLDATGWLQALPDYQQDVVTAILDEHPTPQDAVMMWLAAFPPGAEPFGGEADPSWRAKYVEKVMDEIEALLCGGAQYASERAKLSGNLTQTGLLTGISAAMGSTLGASAAFVMPIVSLVLVCTSKVALNAWCTMRKEERARRPSQSPTPSQL